MLSRILATDSAAVPASHAGGNSENSSVARPRDLQAALRGDDPVDVAGVGLAEASRRPRRGARRARRRGPRPARRSGVRRHGGVGRGALVTGVGASWKLSYSSISTSPAAPETQVRTVSPGVSCTSPVRRSRTRAGAQLPDAGVADAHAAAVGQQRAGRLAGHHQRGAGTGVGGDPAGGERDAAAGAVGRRPGRVGRTARCAARRSRRRAPSARSARRAGRPARRPRSGGPPSRARRRRARPGVSRPSAAVCRSTSRSPVERGELAQLGRRTRGRPACGRSARAPRRPGRRDRVAARSRSMPMTGVMPLPAVTNSSFSGTGSGSTNSPAGGPIRSSVPTGVRCASAPDTVPPGTAVTVTASTAVVRAGGDRVGAPLPHAVEPGADPDELAGPVRGYASGRCAAAAWWCRRSPGAARPPGRAARWWTTAGSACRAGRRAAAAG